MVRALRDSHLRLAASGAGSSMATRRVVSHTVTQVYVFIRQSESQKERERETERERDGDRERERERESERESARERECVVAKADWKTDLCMVTRRLKSGSSTRACASLCASASAPLARAACAVAATVVLSTRAKYSDASSKVADSGSS